MRAMIETNTQSITKRTLPPVGAMSFEDPADGMQVQNKLDHQSIANTKPTTPVEDAEPQTSRIRAAIFSPSSSDIPDPPSHSQTVERDLADGTLDDEELERYDDGTDNEIGPQADDTDEELYIFDL